MKLINIDLDTLRMVGQSETYNGEISLSLGSAISSMLDNKVIFDDSILNDASKDVFLEGYTLSGIHTPLITKDGIKYEGSNILFSACYNVEGEMVSNVELYCDPKMLNKIKIIAGGATSDINNEGCLNLVLKVPKGIYYCANNSKVVYDENKRMVTRGELTNMLKVSMGDIMTNCNILPPRGIYNKKLYRHFKGNWYLVEGVGEYVDHDTTLVSYREMYGNFKLHFREKEIFTSENVKKDEYPLQDFRYMTLEELECSLGADSDEYMQVLMEYNKLIHEHPYITGL